MMGDTFKLADSVARNAYEDDVYAHLSSLAAVEFSRGVRSHSATFRYDMRKYLSLQQAAFEEGPRFEHLDAEEVDWDDVDSRVSAFQEHVESTASEEVDAVAKTVAFSVKCYEHWVTYRSMYPKSQLNPWSRTVRMMRRGRLLFVSDRLSELREMSPSGLPRTEDEPSSGNVGVVVKGRPRKTSGFVIDNRFDVQKAVLSFLSREAPGHQTPASLRRIRDHLGTVGIGWSEPTIQVKATTPLKKSGVVGSSNKGFFIINSLDDLIASYCFHRTKITSIGAILRRYEVRSREFSDDVNLVEECEGVSLNRID